MKFTINNNDLRAEGGKALAEALKDNIITKELSIAKNSLGYNAYGNTDLSGVIAISNAIPTMGAMTSLNISSNYLTQGALKAKQYTFSPDEYETDMTGAPSFNWRVRIS